MKILLFAALLPLSALAADPPLADYTGPATTVSPSAICATPISASPPVRGSCAASSTKPGTTFTACCSTSALAGIAIDRGAMPGSGEAALPYLAYTAYDNPDPRKRRITLGDLLAMRSRLACNDYHGNSPGNEQRIDDTLDWVKATMDLPMIADPGAAAHYCSGGVAVVGRITENRIKTTLPEFARDPTRS